MAALAEPPAAEAAGASDFACPRGRAACADRGTLCHACASEVEIAPRGVVLTDGQVWFMLRVKLTAACVDGEGFETAWRRVTAEIVTRAAVGQARSWRVALEAVRPEFADAYRRRRLRLGQRAATLAG